MTESIITKYSSNVGLYKIVGDHKKHYVYAATIQSIRCNNIWYPHILKINVNLKGYRSGEQADKRERELKKIHDLPNNFSKISRGSNSKYKFTMEEVVFCKEKDAKWSFFDFVCKEQHGRSLLLYIKHKGKYRLGIQMDFWNGESKVDCFGLEHDDNGLIKIHDNFKEQLLEKGQVLNSHFQ